MMEILETEPGTIAVKFNGRMRGEEIDEVTTLVERSLDEHERTHIYVEIHDNFSVDVAAIAANAPRGAAMLTKLDRFGRIAVVTEKRWVRWATKIESAILPGIGYETFDLADHVQALAWVEGKRALPHAPSIMIMETDKPEVIGFEIDGRISAVEADAVVDYFNAALEGDRPLRLLGKVKHLDGAELDAFFDRGFLKMKYDLLGRLDRYAIVGGPAWLRAWVTVLDKLTKAEIRHFKASDEPVAWQWLGAQPRRRRPLVA
ncbi:MAG: STAS/SEC14 domain-containing protein [Allosphingosinicella sp.]